YFVLVTPHPPTPTLFPYTTLFRSPHQCRCRVAIQRETPGRYLTFLRQHGSYVFPTRLPSPVCDGGKTLRKEPAFRSIVAPPTRVSEAMSLKTSAHVGARGTPGA